MTDEWHAVLEAARETNRLCRHIRARVAAGDIADADAVAEYARATAPLTVLLAACDYGSLAEEARTLGATAKEDQ